MEAGVVMNWFFNLDDDGVVQVMARLEGGGMLGDAREEIESGGEFCGISYDALKRARDGEIEIDENGKGRIVR